MRSTNTLQFSTSDEPQRRRSARPTSHTRKNNPHASKSFQSRTLPSGEIIHVATPSYRNVSRAQGARNPGTEAGKIPTTSARETFGTPVLESWQKGNTKRYVTSYWLLSRGIHEAYLPLLVTGCVTSHGPTQLTPQSALVSLSKISQF